MAAESKIQEQDLNQQIAELNAEALRLQRQIEKLDEGRLRRNAEKASESVSQSVSELREIAKRHRAFA